MAYSDDYKNNNNRDNNTKTIVVWMLVNSCSIHILMSIDIVRKIDNCIVVITNGNSTNINNI